MTDMETAEEIIRRKAKEGDRLCCKLMGLDFERDPPYAYISIGGISYEQFKVLKTRFAGSMGSSSKSQTAPNEIRWCLLNRESRRLQSYYEIIPLLQGTRKYKQAVDALCRELSIVRLGPNGMYRHLKDNPGEPWERWDAWIKERRKLFPHGMGEE